LFGQQSRREGSSARPLPAAGARAADWGQALRRWWWAPVVVLFACVLAGVAAEAGMAPAYEATATVEAPPATAADGTGDNETQMQTLAEELGSRALVAEAATAVGPALQTHLFKMPTRWSWTARRFAARGTDLGRTAERQLQIAAVSRSRLIRLQFTAPRPELAASYLARLIDDYGDQARERQREQQQTQVDQLSTEAEVARRRVIAAQNRVLALAASHGVANAATQATLAAQRWQQLASAETTAEINALQPAAAAESGSGLSAPATPPELAVKRASLAAEVGRLAAQYQPQAAPLVEARQELAALDASLDDSQQRSLAAAHQWLDAERQQARALDAAISQQAARETTLQQGLAALDPAQHDLQAAQAGYSTELQQLQGALAASGMVQEPLHVVDSPFAPALPLRPQPAVTLAYALVAGCALSVMALWWLESADDALRMSDLAAVRLPIVAMLPKLPNRALPLGLGEPPPYFERGISHGAAALLLAQAEGGVRSIFVTSPGEEEGKTTVAAQLAAQLHAGERTVLVVDGNPHRQARRTTLRGCAPTGLVDLLAGEATVEQVLRRLSERLGEPAAGPFWIGMGGDASQPERNAARLPLLMAGAAQDLMRAAQQRYDWVIVDGGAALAGPEAGLWASLCDTCLLVARPGRSSRLDLLRAVEALRASGAPITGVMLNQVAPRQCAAQPAVWPGQGTSAAPMGTMSASGESETVRLRA
jgi:Mrp family chromosome partitioning ATPase